MHMKGRRYGLCKQERVAIGISSSKSGKLTFDALGFCYPVTLLLPTSRA